MPPEYDPQVIEDELGPEENYNDHLREKKMASYDISDDAVIETAQRMTLYELDQNGKSLDPKEKIAYLRQLTSTALGRKRIATEEQAAGNMADIVGLVQDMFAGKGNPHIRNDQEKVIDHEPPSLPDELTKKYEFKEEHTQVGNQPVAYEDIMAVKLTRKEE